MIEIVRPVLLLLLLPLLGGLWLLRSGRFWLDLLHGLTLLLVVLALSEPSLRLKRRGGTVVVVADRSASMPSDAPARLESLIRTAEARRRASDLIGVVSFGSHAAIEHPVQNLPFGGFSAAHNPDASNLAEALESALSLIPHKAAARLLVLSDGNFSGADPRPLAALAASRSIAIDYRRLTRETVGDLAIERIEAPQQIRPGEALLATAWINSPVARTLGYRLQRGSTLVAEGTREVPRGRSPLIFRDLPADDAGTVLGYRLSITADEGDPLPENNQARFIVSLAGVRPLLCLTAAPGSQLPANLSSSGHRVTTLQPHQLSGRLEDLAGFSGVVIENTRADLIGDQALQLLAAWIEHAGAGLLMTGGRNSFGMGGYYRSPLESLLPVSLELRREHRKLSLAIMVVLDRSGSMTASVAGGRTKMDLANLGTVEVLRQLSDYDSMGVLAVDTKAHSIFDLTPVGQLRAAESRILAIQSMGGGIYVYEALKAAVAQLVTADTGAKHILLFADASDSEEPGDYKNLLAKATAAGLTVSVIGLGKPTDSDAELLLDIARRGDGRCFFTDNALEVPRLFAQDTFMVARNTWVTNSVVPQFTAALSELSPHLPPAAPALGGYNLAYLQPSATAIAISPDENAAPLVALRRYGSGRTAAFLGEADGAESGSFARWQHSASFYAALAEYCAGARDHERAGVLIQQQPIPGGVRVAVHLDLNQPELRGLSNLSANVLRHRPGETPEHSQVTLGWQSADQLAAEIALTGSETLLASVVFPDGRTTSLPPVCLPYSPEFTPAGTGDGAALLASLAQISGGTALADVGEIWQRLPRTHRPLALAVWLYLLAALLFLGSVFERHTGWFSLRRRHRASGPSPDRESVAPETAARSRTTSSPLPESGPPVPSTPSDAADSPAAATESPLARAKRRARQQTQGNPP